MSVVDSLPLYPLGSEVTAKCSAKGYPRPTINWLFKPCTARNECDNTRSKALSGGGSIGDDRVVSASHVESTVRHVAGQSGMLICQACNRGLGCK